MEQFLAHPATQLVGLSLLVLLLTWPGYRLLKRKRLVENIPTSKCEAVAIGLTELKGLVRHIDDPIVSLLARRSCVYYYYTIEEYQRHTRIVRDSRGHTRTETYYKWVTLESGGEMEPFYVEDETGRIAVVPEKAKIEAIERFQTNDAGGQMWAWSCSRVGGQGRERRFTEWTLEEGDALYVMGTARFDEETGLPFIAWGVEEKWYLITVRSEAQIRRGYAWGGRFVMLLALGAVYGLCALGLRHAGRRPEGAFWALAGIGPVLYALAVSFLLLWNDLVFVRQQVRKADANIDAELKKRADLVPNLVRVVQGYAAHEAGVLEGVTQSRSATAREFWADQNAALGRVHGVAEKYPQLKADTMYLDLVHRLTAIENRLAHLRAFRNDAVMEHNNRAQAFPDLLVARLMGMRTHETWTAEKPARSAVEVRFDRPAAARVGRTAVSRG